MTTATLETAVPLRQDASVMGLVGLAHACSHFSHLLLPVMFPVFMKEFGWSFSELGLMSTVFFVVSGVGQASAGFVVDRLGARPVMWVSVAMFVLACLVAASATGYSGMLLAAVLAGLGNCAFHPVDFTILNQRVSTPRLGYAFSVHGLTGNLGWAAAPAFLMGITALAGWRAAYIAAALLYAGILALLVLCKDLLLTTPRPQAQAGQGGESDLAFMRLPVVWWCFAFFLLSTMTLAVVQNFSVPILKALQAAAETLSNRAMRADALDALVRVREGAPLGLALSQHTRFPGLLSMFAKLGEQTGQLPLMLQRAAPQLSAEVQRRALALATVLEPLLIVAMGGMVMLIVLAVLMPIMELNTWVK